MPGRWFREGLIDSEAIHAAGESAELLFTRLVLVVDDYGRFDGRMSVICRRCWPLGGPDEKEVATRIYALVREGLLVTYEVNGKPFIYIPKFGQRIRQKRGSKYPDPPNLPTEDGQMTDTRPTDDSQPPDECPHIAVSVSVSKDSSSSSASDATTVARASTVGAAALEAVKALTLNEARISSNDATPAGTLSAICTANGVSPATPFHPLIVEWARDGFTPDKLKHAIGVARERKPAPQKIPPAYLDTILRDEHKPAAVVREEKAAESGAKRAAETQRLIAEQRSAERAPMPEHLRPKRASA